MNIVFVSGEINSKVEYSFMIKSKNKSVVYFDLLLENGSIIKCIGYNYVADYCYKNLKNNQWVNIYGKVRLKNLEVMEIF